MRARQLIFCLLLLASPYSAGAQTQPNAVIHWAGVVQQSIHNPPAASRSPGTSQILHTMVHLAVYDAVVAIEGGSKPYAAPIQASPDADVNAAVAAAAFVTARMRVAASQHAFLEQEYERYLAAIPNGFAKFEGIRVGWKSAQQIVRLRANDRFANVVPYTCSSTPPPVGEFEPDTACPTSPGDPQPVDAKVGQIKPFVLTDPTAFRPAGPQDLASDAYKNDFIETRKMGRFDSTHRSAEQTDFVFFWSEHPYVHAQRNVTRLALSYNLGVWETARLFAMVNTSVSDSLIVGFGTKYHFRFWRPRTAIPQTAIVDPAHPNKPELDTDWKPLISVNHPEYPSGHAFWSGALLNAVAGFFETKKVTWTFLTSKAAVPRVEQTERTFDDIDAIETEIHNARVFGGLHWRFSMRDGASIGARVAAEVLKQHFQRDM